MTRTAEPVPEIICRGTRLESGMIGKLGTGHFIWPVPAYRSISRWADFTPGAIFHRGVDIAAPYGTEIYAADAGTVVACTRHWSWGNYVEIDHGNGYKTLYAHMSAQAVQVGDTVEQGQLIGFVGSTGVSSGKRKAVQRPGCFSRHSSPGAGKPALIFSVWGLLFAFCMLKYFT